jgi:hypothetical protein
MTSNIRHTPSRWWDVQVSQAETRKLLRQLSRNVEVANHFQLTRRIALVSFSKRPRVWYDAMALLIAKSSKPLKNPSWYDKVYHTGSYVGGV